MPVYFGLRSRTSLTEYLGDIQLGECVIAEIPKKAVRLISGTQYEGGEYMDSYPIQAVAHPIDLGAVTFRPATEEELRIVRNKENPDLRYLR